MAILFLDFFGSDPPKMDQTCKFGEQTSQILEFKPKGLDFQLLKQEQPKPFSLGKLNLDKNLDKSGKNMDQVRKKLG